MTFQMAAAILEGVVHPSRVEIMIPHPRSDPSCSSMSSRPSMSGPA
jgi:hypothetical protein